MRSLLPIILIVVAVGLFFFKVSPLWADVKELKVESQQYDDAMDKASELKALRGELTQKLNSFTPEELDKLDHFLPRSLDTIRIILDVNGIASRDNIKLTNLSLADATQKTGAKTAVTSYNTIGFSFAFVSSYIQALQFMRDLQQSLRLFDQVNLTVKPDEKTGLNTYSMTLNTYWINK